MTQSIEDKPRVLISQRGHKPTRQALVAGFDHVLAEPDDIHQMDAAERASITGFACLFSPVDAALLDALPNLKIISSFGVGYDHIDARAAAERGIIVTHTPDVLDDEVADTAIGLLINTIRQLPAAETWLRQGRWVRDGHYPLTPLTLRQRTAGIFGLGRIGLAIAQRLQGFGIAIRYHNRSQRSDVDYPYDKSLLALAENCDTLINVAPATPQTRHAINANVLQALGHDGVFINVGRGATVDETALAQALSQGTIAAAGLDVFEDEPNVPQALLDAPNTSLLPHVASASKHTRAAMGQLVIDNLNHWFNTGSALTPVPETAHLNG